MAMFRRTTVPAESASPPRTVPPSPTADRKRLDGMFRDHHQTVWRTLRRWGLDPQEAADTGQQAYVVATERLDHIQAGSERAFLIGTALRIAQANHRKNSHIQLEEDMDPERLTPRNATPFENRMLSAARSETIPSAMKLRMSQGLNLGPAALGGSSVTAVLSMKTVALAVIGAASPATLVGIARHGGGEGRTQEPMRTPNEPAPTVVATSTASPSPEEATPTATERPNANPAHPLEVNLRGEIAQLD
jgi:hypothetical protein